MTSRHTTRRSVAARATAALVLATGVAGTTLAASPNSAAASVRTDSEVVAAQADRALDALDRWQESNRPVHYVRFVRARDAAADLLAHDLGISGDALADEWSNADEPKQVAMLSALTQLGVPYRSIHSEPGVGFDCSGLTIWAFAEAGIDLPRVSGDQISATERIDETDAEPGDLLYYPGHISIYVGEDMMVHSPYTGSTVEVTNVAGRTSRWGDSMTVGND